jgi:hypothetical protein
LAFHFRNDEARKASRVVKRLLIAAQSVGQAYVVQGKRVVESSVRPVSKDDALMAPLHQVPLDRNLL